MRRAGGEQFGHQWKRQRPSRNQMKSCRSHSKTRSATRTTSQACRPPGLPIRSPEARWLTPTGRDIPPSGRRTRAPQNTLHVKYWKPGTTKFIKCEKKTQRQPKRPTEHFDEIFVTPFHAAGFAHRWKGGVSYSPLSVCRGSSLPQREIDQVDDSGERQCNAKSFPGTQK